MKHPYPGLQHTKGLAEGFEFNDHLMGLPTPCLARCWQTLAGAGVAGATAASGGEPAAGGHWNSKAVGR